MREFEPMTMPMNQPILRRDFRSIAARYNDPRDSRQITEHYLLERELAGRLASSGKGDRQRLYGELYTELFDSLPHHPQHTRRAADARYVEKQMALLKRMVAPDSAFVEIGAGDGRLSMAMAMAGNVRRALAVDVTPAVMGEERAPDNFRFVLTEGVALDIDTASVDFVYSNQLMEHLHPDDAKAQLAEIHRVLRPGGQYLCITPNALTGPHDVSRYFDEVARGFHLKEYTYRELGSLFVATGFRGLSACVTKGGRYAGRMPLSAALAMERAFSTLPGGLRRRARLSPLVRAAMGVALIARKGSS
jgi:SAM-dependent methyltransferase